MVSGITVMRELKNISASEKSIPIVKIQAFENYKEEFKKKFIKGISAPRFDLAVTKIEHNNYYLMVCLDMVVFDAPSSYMLIDELFKLYKGGAIQRNREYRYSDYVTLKESRIEDSSNYFSRQNYR